MKKYIIKLIEIEIKKHLESIKNEVDKSVIASTGRLDWFLQEYHPSVCDFCKKHFLAHYGGFYKSNMNGSVQIFCSGKCLDDYKLKNDQAS